MAEQRKDYRYDVHWLVLVGHRKAGNVNGHTINISSSGCLFLCHEKYEIGDVAEIEIWMEPTVSIRGLIRVSHVKALATKEFSIGGEFTHFREDGRELLDTRLLELYRKRWG